MSHRRARGMAVVDSLARTGARFGFAALFMLGVSSSLQNAVANGDTRTLSFHHLHTGEDITVTFKRDGRYDENALKKLDWFMRDWRKEQETHMDPHLFDLLWEVYREVGANGPIDIICGYRSPGTNAMLRARSSGVAQHSQHMLGHAIDFYIPGVPLQKIREVGLRMQRGGVGFYPSSGSPFVHMDTGTIRHWPRIARADLQRIFPDGRTVHIPADGKPLRNYALALADVERAGHVPNAVSLEAARNAGVISDTQVQVAENKQEQEQPAAKPEPGLLARLFGAKPATADEDANEDSAEQAAPTRLASVSAPKPVSTKHIVPLPQARPKPVELADADDPPPPALIAQSDNAAAQPAQKPPFELASLDQPATTGSTGALAYAAESHAPPALAVQAKPMGTRLPKLASAAMAAPAPVAAAPAEKPFGGLSSGGQQPGSPWLRALMLTPSISGYMTMTRVGAVDPRWQRQLFDKPGQAVAMTFSGDPNPGLTAGSFSGSAVVFLATTTFGNAKTASLP